MDQAAKLDSIRANSMNFIDSYGHYLSKNPSRIDSMFQWILCTLFVWFILWFFRERILAGLAADGKTPGQKEPDTLSAREIVIFIFLFIPPPIIFNVAFFKKTEAYQLITMWAAIAPLYYQVFGKFIFDWILAFRSGQSKVTQTVDLIPDQQPKSSVEVNITQTPAQ